MPTWWELVHLQETRMASLVAVTICSLEHGVRGLEVGHNIKKNKA